MYSKRKVNLYPCERKRLTLYQRLLKLLCWIKLIPVTRDNNTGGLNFHVLSFPTLVSSLWCWLPLSYYFYNYCAQFNFCGTERNTTNILTTNLSSTVGNAKSNNKFDQYIVAAFLVSTLLLILLLPNLLGHFSALNPSVMIKGTVLQKHV
jgi:hypothetical protein